MRCLNLRSACTSVFAGDEAVLQCFGLSPTVTKVFSIERITQKAQVLNTAYLNCLIISNVIFIIIRSE